MIYVLVLISILDLTAVVGMGYLIWIDYQARNSFTPGEAAIFREMRRVLDEARP